MGDVVVLLAEIVDGHEIAKSVIGMFAFLDLGVKVLDYAKSVVYHWNISDLVVGDRLNKGIKRFRVSMCLRGHDEFELILPE